jgi:hypothetical protein
MWHAPLVPDDFKVPESLECEGYRLRPLNYDVMLQDYDAVHRARANIAKAVNLDEEFFRTWPIQSSVIEMGWHMGEWRRRRSFTYSIMSHDNKMCYGSVYVYPTPKRDFDAQVMIWTTPDRPDGFDNSVYETVRKWIADVWPLGRVGYPGREISWSEWKKLPGGTQRGA